MRAFSFHNEFHPALCSPAKMWVLKWKPCPPHSWGENCSDTDTSGSPSRWDKLPADACQEIWAGVSVLLIFSPSAEFQKVEKKWGSVERESEAQLPIQINSLTAAIMQPSEADLTSLWLPLDGRKWAHEGGISEHVNSFPALERNKNIFYFIFANMSCPHQKYCLLISPKCKCTFVP